MARTITINPFDSQSIQDAIESFDRESKEFRKRCNEFIKRLAKVGATEADIAFNGTTEPVKVVAKKIEGGYAVIASGEAIAFLEFGAGDMTDSSDMFADQVPFDVSPGSYSRSEKGSGQYERLGKWEFPPGSGNWMSFVMPRNGMQKAYEAVVLQMYQIAREVFR